MASTKEEYQLLVDAEESEIFIISLVEQVVQRSQEVLFEKHIESQVLPYAVQFAKQTIDEIVEWEFFRRDPGDIDPATWEPDTEPEPAVIDSWAPCAMPMRKPPIIPKKATPPPLETAQSESMQSLRSSFSEESEPVLEKRPSVVGSAPLKGSMMSVSSSKEKKISIRDSRMDMGSATSLATSNTSIMRRRAASGSASRRHTAKDSNQQVPLSATQLAEMAIQEENKILLQRIRNMEKDSGKPVEWSYDHEGRVVMVKKGPPAKTSAFGAKSRLLPIESPTPPANPKSGHPSQASPGIPLAAESTSPAKFRNRPLKSTKFRSGAPVSKTDRMDLAASRDLLPVPPKAATSIHSRSVAPPPPKAKSKLQSKQRKDLTSLSNMSLSTSHNAGLGPVFVEDATLEVPSLAETMKIAPGVTLREGDIIKRGPVIPKAPSHPVFNRHATTSAQYSTQAGGRRLRAPAGPAPPNDPLAEVLSRAKPIIRRIPLPAVPRSEHPLGPPGTDLSSPPPSTRHPPTHQQPPPINT